MQAFLFTGVLPVSAQRECQEEAERTSARAYLIESVESVSLHALCCQKQKMFDKLTGGTSAHF